MIYWHKGIPINLISTIDPGLNQTTVDIKWMMNGVAIPTQPIQEQITIDTSSLAGEYRISVLAKNSCGNWSDEYYKDFNIMEVTTMEKNIDVLVDKPVTDVSVTMDFTGTVNVTVLDQLNRPVEGATVQIVALGMTQTTDVTGKAILLNVPYGTQTVKITV